MIRIIASGVAAAFVLTAVAPAVVSAQNTGGAEAPAKTSSTNNKKQGLIEKCEARVDYLLAFPGKLDDIKNAYFVNPTDTNAYPVIDKNSKGKEIKDFFGNKKGMAQAKAQSGKFKGKTNYAKWASNFRGAVNDTAPYYYKSGDKAGQAIDTTALINAATELQGLADTASSNLDAAISDFMSQGKDPMQYVEGQEYALNYKGIDNKDSSLTAPNTFNTADAVNKESCKSKEGRENVKFLRKRASHVIRMVKYMQKTEAKNYRAAVKEYNALNKEIKSNRKDIARR